MRPDRKGRPIFHQVLVYDDPLDLARTIGDFAVDALEHGGSLVLIARREHLEEAGEWVRLSGSLVAPEGPGGGRYQTFDAEDVIGELDRAPNPSDTFEALLATACARIPADTKFVHIFEDLAATLWERGRRDLAVEIEEVGSRLAKRRGGSILCAYPADVLRNPRHLEAVGVCHDHVIRRSTTPRPEVGNRPHGARSKVFPASNPSCRAARQFVRSTVEGAGNDGEVADAAELICSELAANAVRHAHSAFSVHVTCGDQGVRLTVAESESSHVTPSHNRATSFPVRAPRGLGIVSALSQDWGVDDREEGKIVWAELGQTRGTG